MTDHRDRFDTPHGENQYGMRNVKLGHDEGGKEQEQESGDIEPSLPRGHFFILKEEIPKRNYHKRQYVEVRD